MTDVDKTIRMIVDFVEAIRKKGAIVKVTFQIEYKKEEKS